jgi:Ran GTPase-activating protein (RanGAP) involved in mRNA processing and transport
MSVCARVETLIAHVACVAASAGSMPVAAAATPEPPPEAGGLVFEDLPPDVVASVLLLLSLKERCRCLCVCRRWRTVCASTQAAWSALDLRAGGCDEATLLALTRRAQGGLTALLADEHVLSPAASLTVLHENPGLQSLRVEPGHVEDDAADGMWTRTEAVTALEAVPLLGAPLSLGSLHADVLPLLCAGRLSSLRLERCQLGDAEAEVLAACGPGSPGLDLHLSVGFNNLTDVGCRHLAAMAARGDLRSLSVGWNPIGNAGARALSEGLRAATCRLTALDTRHCDIHTVGAVALASALPGCSSLQSLVLSFNHIGPDGAAALAAVLQLWQSSPLRELDVSHNDIGPRGLAAFSHKALARLTVLGLAYNGLCADAARTLAHALAHNTSLRDLDVSRNALTDEGVRQLCVALRTHPALEAIHLAVTAMTREGARRVAGLMRHCPRLRHVDVSGNALERSGGCVLAAAVGDSPGTLRSLNMAQTQADDTVAYALAGALVTPGGRSLRHLQLDDNTCGDDGTCALARACRRCALTSLSLRGIFLVAADPGAAALRAAVQHRMQYTPHRPLVVRGLPITGPIQV